MRATFRCELTLHLPPDADWAATYRALESALRKDYEGMTLWNGVQVDEMDCEGWVSES